MHGGEGEGMGRIVIGAIGETDGVAMGPYSESCVLTAQWTVPFSSPTDGAPEADDVETHSVLITPSIDHVDGHRQETGIVRRHFGRQLPRVDARIGQHLQNARPFAIIALRVLSKLDRRLSIPQHRAVAAPRLPVLSLSLT